MDQIQSHFTNHADLYKIYLAEVGKWVVGAAMAGITLCCFYLIYFLIGIAKLPRDSREYLYKREHLEGDSLLRYIITVCCILIIDTLIVLFFQEGPSIMLKGLACCLLILLGWQLLKMVKEIRKKDAKQS